MNDDPAKIKAMFPILQPSYSGVKAFVPWELVAPHHTQAKKNHDQTLERLAERGGLDWCELSAVLEDRPWHKMNVDVAERTVLNKVVEYYEGLSRIEADAGVRGELRVVFDGPPGPKGGRFVEVETPERKSINVGTWHERDDSLWELRLFSQPAVEAVAKDGGEKIQNMVYAAGYFCGVTDAADYLDSNNNGEFEHVVEGIRKLKPSPPPVDAGGEQEHGPDESSDIGAETGTLCPDLAPPVATPAQGQGKPEPQPARVTEISDVLWEREIEVSGYISKPQEMASINRSAADSLARALLSQFHITRVEKKEGE